MSVFHWKAKYICVSHSFVSDSLQAHGLQPARLFCPWSSPGKNTEVGCHFLFQGIFRIQGLNPGLSQLQADSLPSVVQSLSQAQLFVTPWTIARQTSLSFTISWSLLKLMSIESVMPSNHFVLCRPHLLLPSIFPSIRVFSNELALHIRRPKYWSFSISPSNDYSGLIFFQTDWFDELLAVQGTFKRLLQHHSSKASTLLRSAFFIVQLSHPYTTTGKTIALTMWTFVGKVMSAF